MNEPVQQRDEMGHGKRQYEKANCQSDREADCEQVKLRRGAGKYPQRNIGDQQRGQ